MPDDLARLVSIEEYAEADQRRPPWCPCPALCLPMHRVLSETDRALCFGAGYDFQASRLVVRQCHLSPGDDTPGMLVAGGSLASDIVAGLAQAVACRDRLLAASERLDTLMEGP